MGTSVGQLSEARVCGAGFERYELAEWRHDHGVVAGTTAAVDGFDLDLWGSQPVGVVLRRFDMLRNAFAGSFAGIAIGRQVHGVGIAVHERAPEGLLIHDGIDGHITLAPGCLLALSVADCIPIFLLEPGSGAMALLHAGWRGTGAGILARGIAHLASLAGTPAGSIVMHCGIGICGECYEVGGEVLEAVTGEPAARPGKLDLRAVLVRQARELGVGRCTTSTWCSAHDEGRFFSHRRSRGAAGRMIGYLGKPVT
ncbi:MAG: polyphenol oxidase family protein [Gemmatimonadales bacterium]